MEHHVFILVENGDVYAPESLGKQTILVVGGKIARIGEVDALAVSATGLECTAVDATGCLVVPGFIDPHQHISGAGGEEGFSSRTPEVQISEIAGAGITTVVGLLGTDATTRNLQSLLAKARQLEQEGVTTYVYTGSFQVPVRTLTGSVTDDLVLIDKVIGVGELALSDFRSPEPSLHELARVVSEAITGGLVGGKAGVTHFHTGPGKGRLGLLHRLLDEYEVPPRYLYPTHIERSEGLMDDAIALAKRGAFVDIDVVEPGLGKWLQYYRDNGGPLSQLTVSSDAHASTSANRLHDDFASCVQAHKLPIEEVLPHFTANTATALALHNKGRIREGMDADILVLKKRSLEVVHLIANGKQLVKNGKVLARSEYEGLAQG